MSRFAMVTEDPSYLYDEDGFCVDEDAPDWENKQEDWDEDEYEDPVQPSLHELLQVKLGVDPFSPFATINS